MIYIPPEDGFQETCPYSIPIDPEQAVSVEEWCNDESRAGWGYWTMAMVFDYETAGLSPNYGIPLSHIEQMRYFLWVSDPNIAFEAKIRWAIHL